MAEAFQVEQGVAARARLQRADALERMAEHTLVRPVRHGARVVLPRKDAGQSLLFE